MTSNKVLTVLKAILGVALVIIGLFALVTPFTPGSWLAIIGLELLGMGFVWKSIKPYVNRYLPEKYKIPKKQKP